MIAIWRLQTIVALLLLPLTLISAAQAQLPLTGSDISFNVEGNHTTATEFRDKARFPQASRHFNKTYWGDPRRETGIWRIYGSDRQLGRYVGKFELRENGDGTLQAIRVVKLRDLRHHDGRKVDLVWTGTAEKTGRRTLTGAFSLQRADFITEVDDLKRGPADAFPLTVNAKVRIGPFGILHITYFAPEDPNFRVKEFGIFRRMSAEQPIWQSARVEVETHDDLDPFLQAFFFGYPGSLFESLHELPAVEPFTTDPRFQRAVHFKVVDRTDFDFYREQPNRLRVINKVVDAISLAETELTANAFRTLLADKAAFYQAELEDDLIGPTGMVLAAIGPDGEGVPENDSALWTGVYAYTQLLRYRATGELQAVDEIRRTLTALLILMDITGDPTTFARTLRLTGPPLDDRWVRGTGEFGDYDWLPGGNNDMGKGLLLGMIAGWEVSPENDPLLDAIAAHALDLLNLTVFDPQAQDDDDFADLAELLAVLCPLLDEPFPLCELLALQPGVAPPSANPGMALLLAGITNERSDLVEQGLIWMRQPLLFESPDLGGGPFYLFGISDWSGNHLTLTTRVVLQWLLGQTNDAVLEEKWIQSAGVAWRILRRIESPLDAALALSIDALDDPIEVAEAREQAVWALRSFALPKHSYPVDHRIKGDFVLSPFPALPWKLDWTTNPGRQQSLIAYAQPTNAIGDYLWKNNRLTIDDSPPADHRQPGVDYLFAYWLARTGGIVSADD